MGDAMKKMKEIALLAALAIAITGAGDALAKGKHAKHHAAKKVEQHDDADMTPVTPHVGEKPLMVVRFNQDAVAYEWPLYNTLTKALEVKPQAQFDIVSVATRSKDLNQQKANGDKANADLEKVLATLKEIGMPDNRYDVTKIYDDVPSSEVRIYIK